MLFKVLRVLLVLSLVGFASAIVVQAVLAHGAMQNPMSRVYSCYLENPETPDTLPCKDAIAMSGTQPLYDWNEVNLRNAGGNHRMLIPDGKLCSAGRDKYAAFDQPRLDWPVTILPSSGNFTFNFTAAVPHNMGHFELYVTRNGYDPLQPLKWSDLEDTPFLYVEEPPVINGAYVFSGALPAGKSGRHLIYTIWQRHDSTEAFYSCSDVWFGTSPTPQPTAPPLCTAPDWSSSIVYQMNDLVNHNGKQWRAKWSNTSTEPSSEGGVSPWEIQGYCQRGGGATFTPTSVIPTATRTNTPIVPTATRTNTSVPPTSTRTNTPVVPTATRTNTPFGPTATRTNTPVVPTATRTNTPIVPTATRTNTPIVPTATRTNTPTSGATCTVTYSNLNDWGFGFTTNVVIRNNGSSAINGWTLTWSFAGNQAINNLWNGSYVQNGQSVSVTNLSYNNLIPANGGTVNFGFNAAYSGTNANPTSFSLNGVACQ